METAQAPPTQNGANAGSSSSTTRPKELDNYTIPTKRLNKLKKEEAKRIPLVLCACGSFSPITYCQSTPTTRL